MKLFVCRTEQTGVVRDGRRFANANQFVGWAVKVANHDRSTTRNDNPWYRTYTLHRIS